MIQIKKKWTQKEVEILLKMKKNKNTLKEIAEKFHVSTNAISKALSRHSLEYISIKGIEKVKKNSLLDVINWFNDKNEILKIKKFGNGFLCGKQYFTTISLILILNKFCKEYHRPFVNSRP